MQDPAVTYGTRGQDPPGPGLSAATAPNHKCRACAHATAFVYHKEHATCYGPTNLDRAGTYPADSGCVGSLWRRSYTAGFPDSRRDRGCGYRHGDIDRASVPNRRRASDTARLFA